MYGGGAHACMCVCEGQRTTSHHTWPFHMCSGDRTQVLLFVRPTVFLPGPTLFFFFFLNTYNVYSIRYFRKTYLDSWVLTTCFLIYMHPLLPPQQPCKVKTVSPLLRNEQRGLNLSQLTKTTPEAGFESKSLPKAHGLRDTPLIDSLVEKLNC